ncbi:FMN-binding protein [Ectothiorhodospira sp. BSL-9]|uniref:FMN-binding protein n=1 Tax=Ectothiorhodospira sp. BSL-9 TaxID=1442136 RepID=UPI001438EA1D|nr:FMN-binding protein [Ectothiorhodospira sp. BSL-9]
MSFRCRWPLIIALPFLLAGCGGTPSGDHEPAYEDGTYRGGFFDRDQIQVVVQVTLENNQVTEASFRQLAYGGTDYRLAEEGVPRGIADQYRELLDHMLGKDINQVIPELYSPGEVVTENAEVDGFTSATIRSSKVISALRDALNRGVYSY